MFIEYDSILPQRHGSDQEKNDRWLFISFPLMQDVGIFIRLGFAQMQT